MRVSWRDFARAWQGVPISWRWSGAVAGVLVGTLLVVLGAMDTSPRLTRPEVARVAAFATATGAAEVIASYNEGAADGVLSADEARAVIEAAKAVGPGYGLAADGNSP